MKNLFVTASICTGIMLAIAVPAMAGGEDYKITRTYTDNYAPATINKKVVVQCKGAKTGGVMIAGPELELFYNSLNEEWCYSIHSCRKTLKAIANNWCEALR